jgi:hypothetical protein
MRQAQALSNAHLARPQSSAHVDPTASEVPCRPPWVPGLILLRGDRSDIVYVLDRGRKRRVTSGCVIHDARFEGAEVHVVRQLLVDHLSSGDDWR